MTERDERREIVRAFKEAANMTPASLEKHLDTEDSRRVGWKGADGKGESESVGHASGRRIVALKRKKQADLTADDLAHMKKVVAYVNRHLAQGGPAKDKAHSDWRYSLMNWGHDPLKKLACAASPLTWRGEAGRDGSDNQPSRGANEAASSVRIAPVHAGRR